MQGLQAWLDSNSAKVTSMHVNQYGDVCEIQVIYYTPLRLRGDAMPQLSCLKLSKVTLVLESNARNNSSGNPPLSGTDNSINDCGNTSVSALAQLGTSTTPSGSSSAVVFPALVQLALESCTMPLAVFHQFQHATALTSLTLHGFTITNTEEDKPKASRSEIAAAITDLISHLPSLEHLDFAFSWDSNTLPAAEDGIAPDPVNVLDLPTSLSTMQHLKSLSLP